MPALRILYFADIRFPLERANGIQTAETCHALSARGHDVTLVVRPDTAVPARDPWAFYGLAPHPRLALRRVPARARPLARRLAYLAHAVAAARRPAADVVLTRDLGVAGLLLRVPPRYRPPIVYESHGFAPVVSGALPALLAGGRAASGSKQRRLFNREHRVWRQSDGYVTITHLLAEDLVAAFQPREALAVVPDGVRLDEGRSFEAPRVRRTPIVGYAGHLYPWKGVHVLLEALALLPRVGGLVIGGLDGEPDLEATKALARDLGISGRVRFTGALPPRAVAPMLARSDVLVLPNTATTISARYTSPLKLFEYLAAGRPIVAADLPAVREVLTDGYNAVLAEPGNARALAEAIGRVLDDTVLADRIARQAFDDAAAYTWDRRAARLETLMLSVTATSGRAADGERALPDEPTGAGGMG